MSSSKRNDVKDLDRVQRTIQWARNNRLIAAVILMGIVVAGIASFGDNLSKTMHILNDTAGWVRSPSEAAVGGKFVFADSDGLHFLLKNEGRKPAYIVSGEIDFKAFVVTDDIARASGLDIPRNLIGT